MAKQHLGMLEAGEEVPCRQSLRQVRVHHTETESGNNVPLSDRHREIEEAGGCGLATLWREEGLRCRLWREPGLSCS